MFGATIRERFQKFCRNRSPRSVGGDKIRHEEILARIKRTVSKIARTFYTYVRETEMASGCSSFTID